MRTKMPALISLARKGGLAVIILGLTAASALAHAQQAGQRKVIRLEAIKVEGRIQKPQAFYILQRSNLNFEGLELKQSFVPRIMQSIEKKPF